MLPISYDRAQAEQLLQDYQQQYPDESLDDLSMFGTSKESSHTEEERSLIAIHAAACQVERDPDNWFHHLYLGERLAAAGRYDDALKVFEPVQLKRGFLGLYDEPATRSVMCHLLLNQPRKAVLLLEELLSVQPPRPDDPYLDFLHAWIALLWLYCGKRQQARRWFDKIKAKEKYLTSEIRSLLKADAATRHLPPVCELSLRLCDASHDLRITSMGGFWLLELPPK